jgi:hypothetical protein
VFAVNSTVFLKRPSGYAPEACSWPLSAAGDFFSATDFLHKLAKCKPNTAEHMGCLLGAVIAYARPFTDDASLTFDRHPDRNHCFMGIAADLGADSGVHRAVLLARQELIVLSDPWRNLPGRGLGSHRRMRRFVYPDPRCARIMSRIDLGELRRIAILMRLACVFFLAEAIPAGDF